ncbi:MAG: rRNA pseudouridine synthase [Gammaproteobacteria bacterium]|nr:rRNA pseudouridine synthase [Gammaproteobacteria bacterium]
MKSNSKNINNKPERIQKFLANLGVASRRKIEEMIAERRIIINGKLAELGSKVSGQELILIDGKALSNILNNNVNTPRNNSQLLIYHKPVGKICTNNDPEDRETVFSDLPIVENSRWVSVGRLDINTSGLLLFTTDGNLANKLMHPSGNCEREYLVRVQGKVNPEIINKLLYGIELDDGLAKFKSICVQKNDTFSKAHSSNSWYRVVLTEGRNRIVRRLFEAVDCRVSRLMRIRFGDYKLPKDLAPGDYRIIN